MQGDDSPGVLKIFLREYVAPPNYDDKPVINFQQRSGRIGSIDTSFRTARKKIDRPDLRFHDLRHESVSRFFEMGLSIPEVALISGHKDVRQLFRYTHLKPENLREKYKEVF